MIGFGFRITQTIAFQCRVCRQNLLPDIAARVAQEAGLFGSVRYAVCVCGLLAPDPKDRNYRARYRRALKRQANTTKEGA